MRLISIILFLMLPISVATASTVLSPDDELEALLDAYDNVIDNANGNDIKRLRVAANILLAVHKRIEFIEERALGQNHYILINIASQRMHLVRDVKVLHSQVVIVGDLDNPTPIFSDDIKYIVTNPYWNVPYSLAVRDVMPMLRDNPRLIDRYGYELVNNATGKVVNFDLRADLRKFRLRQRHGPNNALGDIKFMFDPHPKRAIYIHDTPTKHLFDDPYRRESAGCIRASNTEAIKLFVLRDQTMTESDKTDRWVKLKKKTPVHIVDWPTYISDSGNLIVNGKRIYLN